MTKAFFILLVYSCSTIPVSREKIHNWLILPIDEQITHFVSDGCSYYPEGTDKDQSKWLGCCIVHDLAYWKGGTHDERRVADDKLAFCVGNQGASAASKLMYLGTRVGGQAEYDTSYKWGYGWRYRRGYLPITSDENKKIKKFMPDRKEDLRKYLSPAFKQNFKGELEFLSLETVDK